jgi:A/G-specific adenine glycosylase
VKKPKTRKPRDDHPLATVPPETARRFTDALVRWQRVHGRHDLPWQRTRDPYRVWLSEIMLQQTQVGTVIPYYERFLARFPDIASLASAPVDDVMQLWSGLGYYTRARNLHRAAQEIVAAHGGRFPRAAAEIEELPGIGRSTAAAIAAFSFGVRAAILDGNVKRVLARCFGVEGFPGAPAVESTMWSLAESLLPDTDIEGYTQGLMDLGATLCTGRNPQCGACPMSSICVAHLAGRVAELPVPKPRKAVPHRTTVMLVLSDGDAVLLEKRPPAGIWGGLWSFPEAPDEPAAMALARERFGVRRASLRRLPVLRHGFTHYSLDITPLVLGVTRRALTAAEPRAVWLSHDVARDAALPVPAKKVLAALLLGEQAALFEETEEDL